MLFISGACYLYRAGAAARARDRAKDDRRPREGARDFEQESREGRERDAAAGAPSPVCFLWLLCGSYLSVAEMGRNDRDGQIECMMGAHLPNLIIAMARTEFYGRWTS